MAPVVLVTSDRRDPGGFGSGPRIRPRRPEAWVSESYVDAVRQAGGIPLVLPPGCREVEAVLACADGVLLTGGHFDIHPRHYGAEVSGRLDRVEESRTISELELARVCLARDIPVLGVCGGMQAMAVAAGGTLIQDLPKPDAQHPHRLDHEQPTDPALPHHVVQVAAPALDWLGASVQANSTHHQAVDRPGVGLVACGWSEDGVIEVIASTEHRFALGVQWHPELLGQLDAYRALIGACRPPG